MDDFVTGPRITGTTDWYWRQELEQAQARIAELEAALEGALTRNVHAKFQAKLLREACLYFLNCIDHDTGAKDYQLAIKKIRQAVAMSKDREQP